MAKLARTVFVRDPEQGAIRLEAGDEVPERLALLIPNPAAWAEETFPAKSDAPHPSSSEGSAGEALTVEDSASEPEPEPEPEPETARSPRRRTSKKTEAD